MELWIDGDYADELAVLSAWLSVLIPWNVTYSAFDWGRVLFVRFPLFQVRYTFGVPFAEAVSVRSAPGALAFQQGQTMAEAYAVWVAGAVLVGLALLLSLGMYEFDDRLAALDADFSRVMGALLGTAGVLLTIATGLLVTRGLPGIPIPIGLLGFYAMAVILLAADRR